jgi:hypothetical protein
MTLSHRKKLILWMKYCNISLLNQHQNGKGRHQAMTMGCNIYKRIENNYRLNFL